MAITIIESQRKENWVDGKNFHSLFLSLSPLSLTLFQLLYSILGYDRHHDEDNDGNSDGRKAII